jgi:alanyl-tRNA synthetase
LAGLLRTQPGDILPRVETLMDDRRRLERELSEAKKRLAMGAGGPAADAVASIGGVQVMGRIVEGISLKDLKGLVDEAKKQIGSGIVVLVAVGEDGKAGIVAGVTPDLTQRFDAVDLVKVGSEAMGGRGGGGRADMAQAGGPDGGKSADALEAVRARIAELVAA